MNIAITESFLESVFKLDKKIRKYTLSTIRDLGNNPRSDSLKIHKLDNCKCDDSFRSARVNDDVRIIFAMRGAVKTLLYVGHHEDAYDWAEGKFFSKTNFGAEMIYDENLANSVPTFEAADPFFSYQETPLLEKHEIKAKHLEKLCIPAVHAENLLTISDEDVFLDYIQIFPKEIQEALLSLETGEKTFDVIYNELVDEEYQRGETTEHRDTRRRFHMLQSLDELEVLLDSDDFESWTIFLHPEQEKLVRMSFNGPALIEGGPGTGKTIVGIHRAVHLAKNVFTPTDGKKILFCTFSKKLAKSISEKLCLLLLQECVDGSNIDVLSVDAYIRSLYISAYNRAPKIADADIRILMINMYNKLQPSGSLAFYQFEYSEIIEKQHISSLEEYLAAERFGGNLPLNAKQRTRAWQFFEAFLQEKDRQGLISFVDMAHLVNKALEENKILRTYDSIIIDEAQDLEPVKLKVLSRSVISKANNVFILSDMNQRIFKLTSWKKESGISIVGRTHYLYINYRTTKQISDYARNQFVSSDMIKTHIREYKSIVNGVPPTVQGFKNDLDQKKYVASSIKNLSQECPPEQICVICPTRSECESISSVLAYEGIKNTILKDDLLPEGKNGISVCPINGVKGLEFRIVILYNYNNIEGRRVASNATVEIRNSYAKLAECAKYVATTRARDELIITYIEEGEI